MVWLSKAMEILHYIKDLEDLLDQIFPNFNNFHLKKFIEMDFTKMDLNVQFIELAINLVLLSDLLVSKMLGA